MTAKYEREEKLDLFEDKKKKSKLDKLIEKYFDYYSKDCVCQINSDFADDIGKENPWWVNLEDLYNFIDELKRLK